MLCRRGWYARLATLAAHCAGCRWGFHPVREVRMHLRSLNHWRTT